MLVRDPDPPYAAKILRSTGCKGLKACGKQDSRSTSSSRVRGIGSMGPRITMQFALPRLLWAWEDMLYIDSLENLQALSLSNLSLPIAVDQSSVLDHVIDAKLQELHMNIVTVHKFSFLLNFIVTKKARDHVIQNLPSYNNQLIERLRGIPKHWSSLQRLPPVRSCTQSWKYLSYGFHPLLRSTNESYHVILA